MTLALEPWQWGLGAVCAFMNGVAKTGVPGLGILVIPLMLYVVPDARLSPGVVLPLLCLADLFAVLYYRRHARWDRILRLSPWVFAGLGLGMAALALFDRYGVPDALLAQMIGVIVLAMIVVQVLRKRGGDQPVAPSLAKAAAYGVAAGFSTYIANAAGPVMNLYLLSMALPKDEFMGTGAWFFCIINLVKIPQFVLQGRITGDTLCIDLLLAPAVVIGALAGRKLFAAVPQRIFERVVLALTLIATVTLFLPHHHTK